MAKRKNSRLPEPKAAVELRLAKEYWLRTIQPYIADRKLQGVELFVAKDAHLRLRSAVTKAENWNNSDDGKRSPVPADVIPRLQEVKFHEPEALLANESLKPEELAKIAALLMAKREVELPLPEAVRRAHELFIAAECHIKKLPKRSELVTDFRQAMSSVTFTEIRRSNEQDSGQLPLLPPVQRGRNQGQLSLKRLKVAVKGFLEQQTPDLTQKEWDREQDEDARLLKGGLFREDQAGQLKRVAEVVSLGREKPATFHEWRKVRREAMEDCLLR